VISVVDFDHGRTPENKIVHFEPTIFDCGLETIFERAPFKPLFSGDCGGRSVGGSRSWAVGGNAGSSQP